VVDRLGDHLFAGPGFTGDDDGAARLGDGLQQVKQLLHRAAAAEGGAELVALLQL
jgi:hypothetical protein